MWKRRELGRKGRRIEGDSLLSAVTEQGTALFFMVVAMAEYPVLAGPAGLQHLKIFLFKRPFLEMRGEVRGFREIGIEVSAGESNGLFLRGIIMGKPKFYPRPG